MFSVSTINFPAMKSDLLQQELFDHIRGMLPANLSLVEEVSTLLHISHDSAYRRIRGEKSISFAELQTLSTHYRISLDSILKIDSRSSVFYGNWLKAKGFNFKSYLTGLLEHTQRVEQATRKMIYFEAKDFMAYEYLPYPELCAFKYFYWIRSIIDHPAYAKTPFENHDLGDVLAELCPKLTKAYLKIPGTELWSADSINSTLNQIAYYEKLRVFKKQETVELLYEQLSQMLEQIKQQAAAGEKLLPGGKRAGGASYQLYYNQAYQGNNTTLIEADGLNTVFVNHCVVNMILTHDTDFCNNTREYFEETINRSISLNGRTAEVNRERVFNEMLQKVQNAQLKMA
jgi:hypothetical protein